MAGPYLFVGAGMSLRYGSLPSWRDLLSSFANQTGMSFDYYLSGAGGDMPLAATGIAEAFHEHWWKDDTYKESRKKFEGKVPFRASPLKIEIANHLQELIASFKPAPGLEDEFALLQAATIEGVITTNYDGLLSVAFPTFEVFVGQDGLLFSDTQGIAEIYAIHGAATDPESLVLTQSDYVAYDERNAYLAAKLMTIFVEHPVIFLGYSFNDPNIHKTLLSIVHGLRDRTVEKLQDRLIFVEWQAGAKPTIERTQMSVDGHLLPIIRLVVPDWRDVFASLGERQHALPARTLRFLKEQVYEIVRSNDPKGLLYAMSDIDSETAKDVSIVFGVGAKVSSVGIVGLDRHDILRDVLEDPAGAYPPADVLEKIVQKLPSTTWFPIYKYLREAGHLTKKGAVKDEALLKPSVLKRFDAMENQIKLSLPDVTPEAMSDLTEKHDAAWIFTRALELPAYTRDAAGLRTYLIENLPKYRINGWWAAQYVKAVIAYEKIRFGMGS